MVTLINLNLSQKNLCNLRNLRIISYAIAPLFGVLLITDKFILMIPVHLWGHRPRTASLLLSMALIAVACKPSTANSETAAGGVVYGDKSAFVLSAPPGWVLDLGEGRELGVPALFRPSAQTNETFCYAMVVGKSDDCQSIADYLALDLKKLSASGTKVTARELSVITTRKGSQAKVYKYLGEHKGRIEAVAYFETKDSIDVIIYSTTSERQFQADFSAFQQLVQSYQGGLHVDHRVAQ